MRVTEKDIREHFEQVCKLLGQKVATSTQEKGAWYLNHHTDYGWQILSYTRHGRGENREVTSRHSSKEFFIALNLMCRLFGEVEREKELEAYARSKQKPTLSLPVEASEEDHQKARETQAQVLRQNFSIRQLGILADLVCKEVEDDPSELEPEDYLGELYSLRKVLNQAADNPPEANEKV